MKNRAAIIKRLMELADGAEPADRLLGIWYDMACHFRTTLAEVRLDMAYGDESPAKPLNDEGDWFKGLDLWSGKRGHRHRCLAAVLACWIETECDDA